jgi:hypothetical protein
MPSDRAVHLIAAVGARQQINPRLPCRGVYSAPVGIMSRLLLEIYPKDRSSAGGAEELPPVLISTRDAEGVIPADGRGGPVVVLRLQNGSCVLQASPEQPDQPLGLGQWHEAEGWRVRVSNAVTESVADDAALSVADNPSWAAPEIRIATYDGDRVKRLRCMLPVEEGSQLVVGRGGPGADLILEDDHVSRVHMRFFMKDGKRMAEDLGSRWGTKLNGAPLTDPQPLKHGDEIRLGKSTINYLCYWDLLPQQQGDVGGLPVSMGPGSGFEDVATPLEPVPAPVVEAVKSAPRAVPTPVPEIKPEPPPPPKPDPDPTKEEAIKPKPKEVKAATPAKAAAIAPAARPPKRNYWGFDVGGAIFIVLLLVAGMLYLAYLVFKH